MVHKAVLATSLLLAVALVAGCDDDGARTRDQHYGSDAAVGYTGPAPTTGRDAGPDETPPRDAAPGTANPDKRDAIPATGVNDLAVSTDIHDAASSD